jgi:hypothetical protein
MADAGPLLRLFSGDELGYVRCAQAAGPDAASLAGLSVVSRWGDGQRARGVERLTLTDGDDARVRGLLAGAWPQRRRSRRLCMRRHPLALRRAATRHAARCTATRSSARRRARRRPHRRAAR